MAIIERPNVGFKGITHSHTHTHTHTNTLKEALKVGQFRV